MIDLEIKQIDRPRPPAASIRSPSRPEISIRSVSIAFLQRPNRWSQGAHQELGLSGRMITTYVGPCSLYSYASDDARGPGVESETSIDPSPRTSIGGGGNNGTGQVIMYLLDSRLFFLDTARPSPHTPCIVGGAGVWPFYPCHLIKTG